MLQDIVNIVSGGSLYCLITLGLALLVGLMRLMNFAYGELIMVGGFTMYLLRDQPFVVFVGGTVVAVVAVSLLTERIAFRPLRGASPVTLLVASLAVSIMLQNGARMTVGPESRGVPPSDWLQQGVTIGGAQIPRLDLVTIAIAAATLIGLTLLMRRTELGIQLRAAAEDFEMAGLLGVRANAVIASAFAITGVLAALVTLILVEDQGAVTATIGTGPVLIAFVGVVLGGMRSLVGATLGGFLLGAATTGLDVMLPNDLSPFRDAFVFAAVIAVLAFRPEGLVPGRAERLA